MRFFWYGFLWLKHTSLKEPKAQESIIPNMIRGWFVSWATAGIKPHVSEYTLEHPE